MTKIVLQLLKWLHISIEQWACTHLPSTNLFIIHEILPRPEYLVLIIKLDAPFRIMSSPSHSGLECSFLIDLARSWQVWGLLFLLQDYWSLHIFKKHAPDIIGRAWPTPPRVEIRKFKLNYLHFSFFWEGSPPVRWKRPYGFLGEIICWKLFAGSVCWIIGPLAAWLFDQSSVKTINKNILNNLVNILPCFTSRSVGG